MQDDASLNTSSHNFRCCTLLSNGDLGAIDANLGSWRILQLRKTPRSRHCPEAHRLKSKKRRTVKQISEKSDSRNACTYATCYHESLTENLLNIEPFAKPSKVDDFIPLNG